MKRMLRTAVGKVDYKALNSAGQRVVGQYRNDYGVPMTKQFESEVEEMCNVSEGVFEKGLEQGLEKGIEHGEVKLSKLIRALLQSGRTEDVQKAVSDETARKQFYREFGIID